MRIRDWFQRSCGVDCKPTPQSKGKGVSQTTTSWTGGLIDRTTKTPTHPYQSRIPQEGDVALQLCKQVHYNGSETIQYDNTNLKEHSSELTKPETWLTTLRKDKSDLFPGSNDNQVAIFETQMRLVQDTLKGIDLFEKTPDKHKKEDRILPGTTMEVLQNLASAVCQTRGLNAEQVANAIACLQHIDMVGAIADPWGPVAGLPILPSDAQPARSDGKQFTKDDLANAWHLAIALERDGRETGFNLIKHLMRKPAAPGHAHPTAAQQHDALLHTYLKAAREKIVEATRRKEDVHPALLLGDKLKPDPHSIHQHVNRKLGLPLPLPIRAPKALPDVPASVGFSIGAAASNNSDASSHAATGSGSYVTAPTSVKSGAENSLQVFSEEIDAAFALDFDLEIPLNASFSFKPLSMTGSRTDSSPASQLDDIQSHFDKSLPPLPVENKHSGQILSGATMLDKALKAVTNHLGQVEAHAANPAEAAKQITFDPNINDIRPGTNPDLYRVLKKDCNYWALNGVHSNIFSDDVNDAVASEQYRRIQNRANKLVTWLHRKNNGGMGAKPVTNIWDRAKRVVTKAGNLNGMRNKSAFDSYKVAVHSPQRLESGAGTGGIVEGRAIRQGLIWNLKKGIKGALPPAVPDNAKVPELMQMVRLAILEQQTRSNAEADGVHLHMTRHNTGAQLDVWDQALAKEKVYEMFAGGKASQNNATQRSIDYLFERENQTLSPEKLISWANDIGVFKSLHTAVTNAREIGAKPTQRGAMIAYAIEQDQNAAPSSSDKPDWNQFKAAVEHVLLQKTKELRNAGKDLSQLTDTEVGQLFQDVVSSGELGHTIDLESKGGIGIKTQGLSYFLSRIPTLGTAGVGVDLRLFHSEHAYIQAGTSTGGGDTLIGIAIGDKMQAGLGATVGIGHVSKTSEGTSFGYAAGANVTPYSREATYRVAALFRHTRVYSGVDSDDIRGRVRGRLMRKLLDPKNDPDKADGGAWIDPADPADQDILKRILHEFDDLSVGYVKSVEIKRKFAASIGAGIGVKVANWGPYLGIGVGGEATLSTTESREEGGSVNQEREFRDTARTVNVSGIASFLAATMANLPDLLVVGLPNVETWSGLLKVAFHDGVVGSTDIYRTGTTRKHFWIYHDGALNYTPGLCSNHQTVHKTAASFAASILPKIESLAREKAEVFGRNSKIDAMPTLTPSERQRQDEARKGEINQELTEMLRELHYVLTDPKLTREFREYREWAPKFLQMINDLESAIKSEKAKPNWKASRTAKAKVKDYERQVKKLKRLDDDAVRKHGQFRFIITDNVESQQEGQGLSTFVLSWGDKIFRTRRIETYI